jgi:hemolysin activation/secretion protein
VQALRVFRALLLSGGLALVAVPAAAQVAPAPAQAAPTREEIQRDRLDQRLGTAGEAITAADGFERAPCPLANPQFADLRFTLREAQFTGLAGIDPTIVDPAWRDQVGKDLPVSAVCEIRDRAATLLRQAGYLAAVQVPAQTIEDGVVRFDAILARMTDVQVRGDAGADEALLRRYLGRLTGQRVFNTHDAERYLLLARDIPGLDVRLTLQPAPREAGGQPGEVIGVVNVARTPVTVDLSLQNLGSKAVGRFGGLARVVLNGLTGMGDETALSVFSTADFEEQFVVSGQHDFRVGSDGLTLGANATYARTRPDVGFRLKSDTFVADGFVAYPFVRKQEVNLLGTFGLEYIDQTTDTLGVRTNRDTLAVAFARADANWIDPGSLVGRGGYSPVEPRLAMRGSLELRQGLDILGASEGCGPGFVNCLPPVTVIPTRADGDPTAFVVRGEGEIVWRPQPLVAFSLRPRFQWAPHALFAYEEISGGNYTAGRGYDPGAVIGDSGVGAQAEVAFGSLQPKGIDKVAVQPFAFFDWMSVWNKNAAGDPDTITSAGGGVRAVWGNRVTLDSYLAVPLERAPLATRRGDVRALFTLTVRLAPWR